MLKAFVLAYLVWLFAWPDGTTNLVKCDERDPGVCLVIVRRRKGKRFSQSQKLCA
jgi:hypothetical protein